jgi:hypothetical protein
MVTGFYMQDTLKQKNIIHQDTLMQLPDSTAVCQRNPVADVTFYDTNNVVRQADIYLTDQFPFIFTSINRQIHEENKATLMKHQKNGAEIPSRVFENDWIVPLILLSLFFFAIVRTTSKNTFQGLLRFAFSRGINETISSDIGGLFHWQSTLFNLASFINISVFAYCSAIHLDLLPSGVHKILVWIIFLAIIIAAVTIRHFICTATGNISGEKEIFREYLFDIYQAYRLAGIILVILVIMILYTTVIPEKIYFSAGLYIMIIIYLWRISRLFLNFINRHVSIFYLILYLCALEILPVVILIKYVTRLV